MFNKKEKPIYNQSSHKVATILMAMTALAFLVLPFIVFKG